MRTDYSTDHSTGNAAGNSIGYSIATLLYNASRKIGLSAALAMLTLTLFSTAAFAAGTITVTTVGDEYDTGGPLSCSVREAIESANTDTDFGGCLRSVYGTPPYDVVIPAPLIPSAYQLSLAGANEDGNATGDLDIRASMNIIGGGDAGLAIVEAGASSAEAIDRVFHITSDDLHVTFTNITVRHGQVMNEAGDVGGGLANTSNSMVMVQSSMVMSNAALGDAANEGGGGLFNGMGGTLIVSDSVISGNHANAGSGSGGGILNRNGSSLHVVNSEISGNMAAHAGGGIEDNGSMTTLENVSLLANSAGAMPGNGGGLHSTGASTVSYVKGTVMDNVASAEGGGLWNSMTGTMSIDHVHIVANIASGAEPDQGGGGLFNDGGDLTVTNSLLRDNVADGAAGSGGGILNTAGGTLTVENSVIQGNRSMRAGGGIEDNASTTMLTHVDLLENATREAPGNGGGLHSTGASMVTILSSSVVNNRAEAEGGGLWNSGAGTMHVDGVLVAGNHADGSEATRGGGGIFNVGGPLSVSNSTISENSAANNGGGIKVIGGESTFSNVTLYGNFAHGDVSAVVAMTGTVLLGNSLIGAMGEQSNSLCSHNVMAAGHAPNLATDDSCGASLVANTFLGDTTNRWWVRLD